MLYMVDEDLSAIDDTSLTPVNETYVRSRYDDVFEAAAACRTHGLPSPKGVMKPVCFYHTPGHASRHAGTRSGVLRRASDQRGPSARSPRRARAWRSADRRGPLRIRPGPLQWAGR